jgi:hypothetical protein
MRKLQLKSDTDRLLIVTIVYVAGLFVLSRIFNFNGMLTAANGITGAIWWDCVGLRVVPVWGIGGLFVGGYLVDQLMRD